MLSVVLQVVSSLCTHSGLFVPPVFQASAAAVGAMCEPASAAPLLSYIYVCSFVYIPIVVWMLSVVLQAVSSQ